MTNIFQTPKKGRTKTLLFQLGVKALQQQGYKVERIQGIGKSSVRRITKGSQSLKVAIRTSQDTWIAFPRDRQDKKWVTLSEVDAVVAVTVDNPDDPRFAQVHMIEGDDMRKRFDRAYRARVDAGHQIPLGRGIWVSLYREEAADPVVNVGAGAGLANPPIARFPLELDPDDLQPEADNDDATGRSGHGIRRPMSVGGKDDDGPLTIPEAKRRLALHLGVDPASIKITVEA
ncbi:hypothetical protein HY522_02375 [bacterium]|nr:hypothetical protein [bacterium]